MSLTAALPMLEGVRIVDMTSVVFGPYATQILADFGADVVKVEAPSGDIFRYSSRSAKTRAMSAGHIALNRGKRSVVLDLKDDDDRAAMRSLIAESDVFIHNVRKSAIERLGFGYQESIALNEALIYVHCVGFGAGGPYEHLQAYDDVIQAATGTTSLLGRVDGDSAPRYFPSLIADKVAGLNAAYATLGAVIHKLRTGRGQHVEVPMFEAFANFMLKEHLADMAFDPPLGPACYARQIEPDRQPFPTANGHIVIVPYSLQSWDVVYEALGYSEFLDDEKFNTPRARVKNLEQLYKGLAERTPEKTSEAWCDILRPLNIPCMPVRDIDSILEDPHLQATGFFQRREHPTEGWHFEMREAASFSDWSAPERTPAPTLGEHSLDDVKRRG
ncbi:MAG: CoA transferase [Pseudomonadota bacterium]